MKKTNKSKSFKKRSKNTVFLVQCIICIVLFCIFTFTRFFNQTQFEIIKTNVMGLFQNTEDVVPLAKFSQEVVGLFFIKANATTIENSKTEDEINAVNTSSDNNTANQSQKTQSKDEETSTKKVDYSIAPDGTSFSLFKTNCKTTPPVKNYYISSNYGWRKDPFTNKITFHTGIDLACAEGESVFCAIAGVIQTNACSSSYGNYIRIRHEDGSVTLYAHLQYAFVHTGEIINVGEQIGTVGSTGRSTGPHLHFETMVNNEKLNPSEIIL